VDYKNPRIETLKASEIIEMLGPVSCGSADPSAAIGGNQSSGSASSFSSGGGGIQRVH
jgi:hypothetical protein